jgi:hypothetical protein
LKEDFLWEKKPVHIAVEAAQYKYSAELAEAVM